MINGEKPLSQQVLNGLIKMFPKVNINWLLTGIGEPMIEGEGGNNYQFEPSNPAVGEPQMVDVERLREAVLVQYKPDPPLTLGQDLVFRQACYRVLVDNPGQPWSALVVGAGVYLRFIETIPGVQIPVPRKKQEDNELL